MLMLCWCMYTLALIGISADICMGIFMLFTNVLAGAICCCLQTCNVYGALLTL